MDGFIYDRNGNPVGYINNNYIHTLQGIPVGQVNDTHVHKLTGEYVGELYMDMIVEMNLGDLGNIGDGGNPGNPGFFGIPENRGAVEIEYPEVFTRLLDRVNVEEEVGKYKRHLF